MLSIVTYPNRILDTPAQDVSFPLDNETKNLINQMWSVVKEKGVGLAAPQVGVSKKICLIHLSEVERGRNKKDILMINPEVTFESRVQSLMVEGCLSFPGEYWKIWRSSNITVEYYNVHGKKQKLRAGGWLARVILHEVDHLNGKVFILKGGQKIDEKDLENESEAVVD